MIRHEGREYGTAAEIATHCAHCRTKLDATGRCPGDTPLTRDRWGSAAQIAHRLGLDVTAKNVHDWATRAADPADPLHGLLDRHNIPGRGRGTTYFDFDQAESVEYLTRTSTRGQRRQLDTTALAA